MVKNLLAKQETWVQSLGWKNLLELEMATCSSILAWKIPWIEEPGRLQSTGSQKSWTQLRSFTHYVNAGNSKKNYQASWFSTEMTRNL